MYTDANGKQWVELYNPWGNNHPKPIPYDEVGGLFRSIYTNGDASEFGSGSLFGK
jgi:hypothetical protein